MNLGAIAGLTGLSKSVDYVGQNQREFAQMDNIEKDIAKDEQANLMAQELEAKQYEEIANKATEMLEPDRIKIKARSLEFQKTIRSKIEEYGSRKAFFENGGVGLLSKYKSDILTSPETLSYTDNKKNMEQLMKIMADGKGHLIADIDKQKLDDYNAGIGDGKISYSGMKSEVTIPEKYYNYGEDVPAEVILKSNYLQIYNNWLLDNPNMGALKGKDLNEELLSYTYKNHYGQGVNMQKYQSDLSEQQLAKQRQAVATAGTGKNEEIPISYVAATNRVLTQIQASSPARIHDLMNPENFLKKTAVTNKSLSGIFGRVHEYVTADSNYVSANWGDAFTKTLSTAVGIDNKYTPASAVIVPMLNKTNIMKELYQGTNPNGNVNVGINSESFYAPNGNKLPEEYVKRAIKNKLNQDMVFGGLIYAYIDDKDNLVTQIKDSSGKMLGKKDEKTGKYKMTTEEEDHMSGFSGNLKNEMFAILTTKDGEKIYQRLDVNSMKGEDALAKAIGKEDDVTTTVKRRQQQAVAESNEMQQVKFNAKVVQNDVAIASGEGGIFNMPEFKADASLTKVANGFNRYNAVKAYYMALTYITENGKNRLQGNFSPDLMLQDKYYLRSNPNNFQKAVNYSKELSDKMIDSKISDVDFIKEMGRITSGDVKEHQEENKIMTDAWIKFYELINKK
jgi:biotin-(acetyl-CoA carboxylase) ligase